MSELAAMSLLASPAPVPVRPTPMSEVTWHSIDLRTGRRGAPVRPVKLGTVSRVLSAATETTLDVTIWDKGKPLPEWEGATTPGLAMLVAVDQDDEPIWGGMVYRRRGTKAPVVNLALVTLEAYLDRRYIDYDHEYGGADQVSQIAQEVIQDTLPNGILFTIDAPFSGVARDREYLIDDDKTVLSVLNELAGIENGIEFTVDLRWTDATHTVLERVFRIRNRIGTYYLGATGVANYNPPAVFHMPGSVVDFEYLEDYSSDAGANVVMATSSGEGDSRPESSNHIANNVVAGFGGQWAAFEKRFAPSTSIVDITTLDNHATAELLQTWDGLKELTLEAKLDTAPRLNEDWWLGDDVGVQLTCPRFPETVNVDGVKLPGYQGTVRNIGWEIDFDARLLRPKLLEVREVEIL